MMVDKRNVDRQTDRQTVRQTDRQTDTWKTFAMCAGVAISI